MVKSKPEAKIFITRDIPSTGPDLLRKEGFSVTVWPHDRPIPADELLKEAKNATAVLCLSTDIIDAEFFDNVQSPGYYFSNGRRV